MRTLSPFLVVSVAVLLHCTSKQPPTCPPALPVMPTRVTLPLQAADSLHAFKSAIAVETTNDAVGTMRTLKFRDCARTRSDAVETALRADGYVVQRAAIQMDLADRLRFTRAHVFGDILFACGGACTGVTVRYQIVDENQRPVDWTTPYDNRPTNEECKEDLRTCRGVRCSGIVEMCAPSFDASPDFPFPTPY